MNMDYCKFENTLNALRQCWEDWELDDDASEYEKEARESLINLIREIYNGDAEVFNG